jgi:DNA ligase-associated metallophosphoesterase
MNTTAIDLCGERLLLHPERALYWPRRRTLFVADTHLGKGSVFRRAGLAVPAGTSDDDLARLEQLVAERGAERLIVLGDFMHAPPMAGDCWPASVAAWLQAHRQLQVVVIAGNHDAGFRVPADWDIDWRHQAWDEPPFSYVHEPTTETSAHALAGHWHPTVSLRDGRERVRVPAFVLEAGLTVLPAFGRFTGGQVIEPDGRTLYGVAGDRVLELG